MASRRRLGSEEAFRAFGDVLVPVLQEIGLGGEPQVFPLHKFVKYARRATYLLAGGGPAAGESPPHGVSLPTPP